LIICTNDDGLGTIGLESLAEVCREFGDVKVMAPDRERSLCSHSLDPTGELKLKEVRPEVFSLSGTPADCTRIALRHFDEKPALLCSGINHGGNLGVDALYSGTMAAAREAYIRGISAISFSMVLESGVEPNWEIVKIKTREVLEIWKKSASEEPIFWNVNFPSRVLAEMLLIHCDIDETPMDLEYERVPSGYKYVGRYHDRPRADGGDVETCFKGKITLVDMKGRYFLRE
jgi:5'-nucleotidase